jgi:predicted transcriptional regulator
MNVLRSVPFPGRIPTMSTTTIRLDEDLKARVAAVAERAGKTTHAFILDAIADRVEQAELEDEFHRIADKRWAKVLATGATVPWDEAKAYLEARARGERVRKPAARKPAARKPS